MTKTIEFGWHLPTGGDGKYVGVPNEREGSLDYIVEVAQASEKAGFEFILIPTGGTCTDAFLAGTVVAATTTILKPLVAVRPGLMSPVVLARMATSLDYLSNGRALLNIVSGGNPQDLQAYGDPLYNLHDERYKRTSEFVSALKQLWECAETGETTTFKGQYVSFQHSTCYPAAVQAPQIPLYFGGSSTVAKQVAAEIADVYLMWAEPLQMIQEQIQQMEQHVQAYYEQTGIVKKTMKYGLRVQVVVRETSEQAWKDARDIISQVDEETLQQAAERQAAITSTNQKRQSSLWHQSAEDDFVIGPNLWAGISRIRPGGSVVLVGSVDEVIERIVEFVDIGISSFIFSGYPHLEEVVICGELLLPKLKEILASRQLQSS